ncbi:MAG: putative Ig domain-containing protein [Nitrospira sp.]|nr:putative Ig domain-containing protein [Nitrospira sp.]
MRNRKGDVFKVWLPLLGVTLCFACTDGEVTEGTAPVSRSSSNRPPVVTTAVIVNTPLSQSTPAAVQIQSEDPEREAVSFHYQWYVDHTPIAGQTSATLPPEFFRRGQTVFVEIIPTDGTSKGQPYRTAGVVVGNTSPRITAVSLVPQTARVGDKIEARVEASDPEHDRVDLIYKWYRNDTLIKEGEDPFLDTVGFSSPDQVAVEVTASDPTGSASSLKSESIALGNSGPMIVSTPPTKAVQERFDYSVKALDPDGDPLTYHLEMAPPGMTISSDTGHIGWQIPTDQEGTFHVRVVAKDGRGGLATQEFDVTLSATTTPAPRGA